MTGETLDWERTWWGNCANTFHEEEKQLVYARMMGLVEIRGAAHPPTFDVGDRSIVDVGGGPVSLLLKCAPGTGHRAIVDPCRYPAWVIDRYLACDVDWIELPGEGDWLGELEEAPAEVWIYNVLQHSEDPERIVANALTAATGVVRIFEWVGVAAYEGHPQELSEEALNGWLGARGVVGQLDERGAVGLAYFGVFAGRS